MSFDLHMSQSDYSALARLVGQTWRNYGAATCVPSGSNVLGSIFVRAGDQQLSLAAVDHNLLIEGVEEEFTSLTTQQDDDTESLAESNGNLFYFFKGATVDDIFVVRDEHLEVADGIPQLSITADSGLVVEFHEGAIGVMKGGWRAIDLIVSRAASVGELDLFDGSSEWVSRLDVSYEHTRQLVSVSELVIGK